MLPNWIAGVFLQPIDKPSFVMRMAALLYGIERALLAEL